MGLETATNIGELNPAWPLGSDGKNDGDNHIRMIKAVLQTLYPVGHIMHSSVNVNPAVQLGFGTWVAIEGVMLLGTGDNGDGVDRVLDDVGGAHEVTLTTGEMPVHDHGSGSYQVGLATSTNTSTGGGATRHNGNSGVTDHAVSGRSGDNGNGNAHENMPPFRVIHMWERTA